MHTYGIVITCKELNVKNQIVKFHDIEAMKRAFDWYSKSCANRNFKSYDIKQIKL